jgi:hypothetical protein
LPTPEKLPAWRAPLKKVLLRWNSRYRELQRIVASGTLSPALVKFLQFIVIETLEGRGDRLTESFIAEKVFNQREFTASEKSVVRVEKRRLREKLKDYYESAGKGDPLVISLGSTFVPVFSPRESGAPQRAFWKFSRRWVVSAAVVILALLAGAATAIWLRRTAPEDFALTQLTYDSGYTTNPAISPDGKLVVYASDRSGEGNLDIWVQDIAAGDRARLAPNPADDSEPSFSPDGSKVVFHSDRDGGGIYSVAVLGGDLKLIATRGRGPRFSPDGQKIVYWVGESYFVRTQVYVVAATGGTPRPVQFGRRMESTCCSGASATNPPPRTGGLRRWMEENSCRRELSRRSRGRISQRARRRRGWMIRCTFPPVATRPTCGGQRSHHGTAGSVASRGG